MAAMVSELPRRANRLPFHEPGEDAASALTTQKFACSPTRRGTYCTHEQPHTRTCMPSTDELAIEICTLSGHINAANHRFLVLVGRRHAILRTLAQLEMRHRTGCRTRKGTRCPRAREAAKDFC